MIEYGAGLAGIRHQGKAMSATLSALPRDAGISPVARTPGPPWAPPVTWGYLSSAHGMLQELLINGAFYSTPEMSASRVL